MHRIEDALSGGAPCLFLSPHLDDAVLSCGALMRQVVAQSPVTVATVFTAASAPPHTYAARSFLRQCGAADAGSLFAARRAEDRTVLDRLGARNVHMGRTDALFRRRGATAFGRWLPELTHRYPTYRFDIALGRVSRGDRRLVDDVATEVAALRERVGADLVFAPVGIGRHVDHLVTRAVGEHFPDRVVYYADFPYNVAGSPDPDFLARHRLTPWQFERGLAGKQPLIRGYRTQAGALFPDGRIPVVPETFYVAAS